MRTDSEAYMRCNVHWTITVIGKAGSLRHMRLPSGINEHYSSKLLAGQFTFTAVPTHMAPASPARGVLHVRISHPFATNLVYRCLPSIHDEPLARST